ncbi:hypothetical protein NpNSSI1_00012336 [Neofusicoccum parvum]|nr:hypothetical protein NpNSSI1_00012336 [Neofusicoccum parvum]
MPSSGSRRARRALARNAHNHAATACPILRLPLELLQHVFSYVVDDASIRRHLVTPLFGMLAFHELRLVCVKFYYAVPGARREWGRRRDGVLVEKRPVWVMGEGKVRKEWGRVLRAVNGSGEGEWEGARVREWRRVLEGMGVGVWRDGEAEERRERRKLKERVREDYEKIEAEVGGKGEEVVEEAKGEDKEAEGDEEGWEGYLWSCQETESGDS